MSNKTERKIQVIAKNRRAHHDYHIDETFEAGVVLSGTEVKSLRERHCQLSEAFALIRRGEAFLHNVHIAPYSHGSYNNPDDPARKRKLLLHKREIIRLGQKTAEQGRALVPLMLYFDEHNRVKLQLGLGRGKKLYDKREDNARRDAQREIARAIKAKNQG